MDLAHALVVAVTKVLPVIEHERERGRSRELRLRIGELEDPCEHRVHHDRALVEIEDEELPAMAHAREAPMRESRLDRAGRSENEWVSDTDQRDLMTDERLFETVANDVKVGPLGHYPVTASSQRGSGRSNRRAAQRRHSLSWSRCHRRTRGSPGIGGRPPPAAKKPAAPRKQASEITRPILAQASH